ncbi:MAG: hypothetical protein O2897_01220, partial [bacterium]|nr:hypothetical protein [bacterium]
YLAEIVKQFMFCEAAMSKYFLNSFSILALVFSVSLNVIAGGPDDELPQSPKKIAAPASPKTPAGALSGRANIVRPVLGPRGAGAAATVEVMPNRRVLLLTPNTNAGPLRSSRPVVKSLSTQGVHISPQRPLKRKRPIWGRSIYFIGAFEEAENVPVVDLHNHLVTEVELFQLLEQFMSTVNMEGHRYVGKTKREVKTRFREHARACGSKPERRLPKALIKRAISDSPLPMRVLIANVHPDQLAQVEAWVIEWIDGTGDLGLNSCTGAGGGKQKDDMDLSDEEVDSEDFYVDSVTKTLRKSDEEEDDDEQGGSFGSGASCAGSCLSQVS